MNLPRVPLASNVSLKTITFSLMPSENKEPRIIKVTTKPVASPNSLLIKSILCVDDLVSIKAILV